MSKECIHFLGHSVYSALHVINTSTVSHEYFKILHHSQSLPNIQARVLLKRKFLGSSFKGPPSALGKAFQRAHGPAIWVWIPKFRACRMIQNYEHENDSNTGQYAAHCRKFRRLKFVLWSALKLTFGQQPR